MPRDLDEDEAAPLDLPPHTPAARPQPRSGPVAPPAARPAPPVAKTFRWGVAGVLDQADDLLTSPGARGVVRFVSSGVEYTAPPLPAAHVWRAVPAEPGRYEMAWDGDPAEARTLADLRRDLEAAARAGAFTRPGHALLAELDETAAALTAAAGRLHGKRWSLGLVRLDNVVFRSGAGGREAVLTDLGFAWKGAFGSPPWDDSPGRPDWLDPDAPPAWLWDHPPVRRQFADPGNGVYPPADATADVRTLGRLLAWLVSGQTAHDLPAIGGPAGPPPPWAALVDAAAGRVASADDHAARLRDAPMSHYFYRTAPPKPPVNKLMVAAIVLVFLATGGVGAYLYLNPPVQTAAVKPDDGQQKKPDEPAKKPDDAKKADDPKPKLPVAAPDFTALAAGVKAALARADLPAALDALSKLAATPGAKPAEVDALRETVRSAWVKEATAIIAVSAKPGNRHEAKQKLDRLVTEMKALTDTTPATNPEQKQKEQQCLTQVSAVARQLAASPSSPPPSP